MRRVFLGNENNSIKERVLVKGDQLRKVVNPAVFEFETTEEVSELTSVIGQERGMAVMSFGLQVKKQGYNLYVAGIPGTGKTTFTNALIDEIAENDVELFDYCYVHNFENSYKPQMLQLPVGIGKSLQIDMDKLIENAMTDIPNAFNEENYQKERAAIMRQFKQKNNEVVNRLSELAKTYGFAVRQSSSGFISVPLKDGEPMSEEEYKKLPDDKLAVIKEKSSNLEEKVVEFTNEFEEVEEEMNSAMKELDEKVALTAIGHLIEKLRDKYQTCQTVLNYLEEVQSDVLKNVNDFLPKEEENNPLQAMMASRQETDFTIKYRINLLVDNSETKGAPVVTADNPTFYNLVGKVEYENRMGMMSTNFTKIKPGFLHEANGGYIIIQAKDILSKGYAWEALKRALDTKNLRIENIGEHTGLMTTTSLSPDAMPLNVKVILIGNSQLYQLLHYHDEDFSKLFKIKADFDVEMDYNVENMSRLASFIHTHSVEHDLLHFDKGAVARLVEYSTRLAGHQKKLSTRFNQIVEIIYEADSWAKLAKKSTVNAEIIEKTLKENEYRNNLIAEKMQEQIKEKDILIDTSGSMVGQVNGLAVYSTGQYMFGKPSRITATTYLGRKGIINIESESKLSGNIHNKGVYILSGYLGEKFAQRHALALTANVTFEQSYGGVDGDSASSTELYALLSSLADVPIDQSLAVTGSVNQKGEVQPIGGVNEKIEGFFAVCEEIGLTGKQGVLIPQQNVKNLMLKPHVAETIKAGNFHIYAVRTIEEGIELLTNMPAGSRSADGFFEEGTLYGRVQQKLKAYYDSSALKEDNNQ